MLAPLDTLKARLAIDPLNVQYDDLLTNTLLALSARFDAETNRTLARTLDATFEFDADNTEISVPCYPIESVSKFELKTTEAEGWFEATAVAYLLRNQCIISLHSPLSTINSQPSTCRVTYTGGYLLPGSADVPSAFPLPPELEQAAIEQATAWFLRRDMLALDTSWPKGGILQRFSKLDLLLPVQQVISRYRRLSL